MKDEDQKNKKVASRLANILVILFYKGKVDRKELVETFGVNERTIYRDLDRLGDIVTLEQGTIYTITEKYRPLFSVQQLEKFAELTGTDKLFPTLHRDFLTHLMKGINESVFVKGHFYEDSIEYKSYFQKLIPAISERKVCNFKYDKKDKNVYPYALINNRGVWYLVGIDAADNTLKRFSLSRIDALWPKESEKFTWEQTIFDEIKNSSDIWYSNKKFKIKLEVSEYAKHYFLRRELLPMTCEKKEIDNILEITCDICSAEQILPTIRQWIPHIKVIEPLWLKDELNKQLVRYLA